MFIRFLKKFAVCHKNRLVARDMHASGRGSGQSVVFL